MAKRLEFETSKGKFILSDDLKPLREYKPKWFLGLKELTEEQASEIVDNKPSILYDDGSISLHYRNYLYHDIQAAHIWKSSAIESLHSLLKSKGVHLYENSYANSTDLNDSFFSMQTDFNKEKEAEEKTFYNPYIFKLQ